MTEWILGGGWSLLADGMPLAERVIKLLAVVGVAAVGGLGLGFLVRVLGKFLMVRQIPPRLMLLIRGLGAVVMGWVAWLILFGPGGFWGMGLGSGAGEGSGKGTGKGTAQATQPAGPTSRTKPDHTLQIVMYGGARVKHNRFYLIAGETEARTFPDLKKVLQEKKKELGLQGIEIMIYDDSVDPRHVAVRDLEEWARDQGFTVSLSSQKGDAP
jgi:hypothetical protein